MASLKSWRDILKLLSSLITFSLVLGAKCREGFHETEKGYCCRPVSCSKNQQFHLCMQDYGSDTCKPCEDGLINPERIETNKWSYQYDVCRAPDCECAPEAVLLDPEECMKSGIAICFCDRKEWFYGEDPLNCQKANDTLKRSAMERGMELKLNGTVGKCSPGYFKAKSGSSICTPHSKCPEGHSVEIPGTTFKDNICKRDPSTSVPTLPREPTSPSPISPDKEDENNPIHVPVYIWVLVGLGVTLIVALAVLIILKNRWKAAVQMRNNVGETVDPEKGSLEQPLIEVNKKKHLSASTVSSQNQDCCNKSEDSFLAANQRQEPNEQGPQEQRQLFERKKDPSESGKTHTLYHEDQIELGGSSLDFSSLFDSQPSSGMTSGGNPISNLLQTSVPQDSHGRSLQATSEDLGIGLSADSKNVNEIQKSGQTQGREEQPVSGDN